MPDPARRFRCRVASLETATHDTRIVRLEVVAGGRFRFRAGQYASVAFADYPPRDYSMANPPDVAPLEFHIRRMGDGGASDFVADGLAPGDPVAVEGPFGDAWLRTDHSGPILAVAGGSGLAPIKSIVDTALGRGMTQPIRLYFGVREARDLYLVEHFEALARAHPNLRFVPVLSDPEGESRYRTGLVHEAVAEDVADAGGCKAYVAGPPVMAEATVATLAARGVAPADIHADPFYPADEPGARLNPKAPGAADT